MNCFNHPQQPAVAQCVDCGKGLCSRCAAMYQPILCASCYQARRDAEVREYTINVVLYIAFFIVGFATDFLEESEPFNTRWLSAYSVMAARAGYILVERYFPFRLFVAHIAVWALYLVFKLVLYFIIVFFVAPFMVVREVYRLVRASRG